MAERRVLVDGLVFAEGPRWHDGALWFSDIHDHKVHRVTVDDSGNAVQDTIVAEFEDLPSGLGFLPDGSLLVVLMESARIARVASDGTITEHADCSALRRGTLNDMVVARDGTAYAGDMGMRIFAGQAGTPQPGQLLQVAATGEARVARDELRAPNGIALNEAETRLFVAESAGARVIDFDLENGTLGEPREFAVLPVATGARLAAPDGICVDEAGAVWAADPIGARVIRLGPGDTEPTVVAFPDATPVAAVLGGPQRRTLFVCVADDWHPEALQAKRSGRIEAVTVDVSGAGRP